MIVAGIVKAIDINEMLPVIIVFSSGIAATAFFYSLAAILDRQNAICLMLLLQHNPEVQEELIDLINEKRVKSKVK